MDWSGIVTSVVSLIAALGGLELLKWLWTRKSKARMAAAEADVAELKAEKDEYYLLRERLEFMDKLIIDKDKQYNELRDLTNKRYDEQTSHLRKVQGQLNEEIKNNGLLSAEIAALKAERAMKLCQVRNCSRREPQSGY